MNENTVAEIVPLLHRLGLVSRVVHIQTAKGRKLVFGAYDQFADGCVWIRDIVSPDELDGWKQQGLLKSYSETMGGTSSGPGRN